MRWTEFFRVKQSGLNSSGPTSARLQQSLRDYDVRGERAIAIAQGAICCFILVLHSAFRLDLGIAVLHSWLVVALGLLIASSVARWLLVDAKTIPERKLDALNVLDIGLFMSLIWSCQFAYNHPAGGSLKAPTFVLLFVLIALRALRLHPRPILIAGMAALFGWVAVACGAVIQDGSAAVTGDYLVYLTTFKILPSVEIEKLVAIGALTVFLAIAASSARQLLGKAAHAGDYADALDAARRNLDEAKIARNKSEVALWDLDRHKAELTEQNRRFDAALRHMSQGICMFDADQRLLVCNDRYLELYGLTPGTRQARHAVPQDHRVARRARPLRRGSQNLPRRAAFIDQRDEAQHQSARDDRRALNRGRA